MALALTAPTLPVWAGDVSQLVDLTQAWYEVKPATAPAVPKSAAHSAAHLMARAEQVLEQQSALFETSRWPAALVGPGPPR